MARGRGPPFLEEGRKGGERAAWGAGRMVQGLNKGRRGALGAAELQCGVKGGRTGGGRARVRMRGERWGEGRARWLEGGRREASGKRGGRQSMWLARCEGKEGVVGNRKGLGVAGEGGRRRGGGGMGCATRARRREHRPGVYRGSGGGGGGARGVEGGHGGRVWRGQDIVRAAGRARRKGGRQRESRGRREARRKAHNFVSTLRYRVVMGMVGGACEMEARWPSGCEGWPVMLEEEVGVGRRRGGREKRGGERERS